ARVLGLSPKLGGWPMLTAKLRERIWRFPETHHKASYVISEAGNWCHSVQLPADMPDFDPGGAADWSAPDTLLRARLRLIGCWGEHDTTFTRTNITAGRWSKSYVIARAMIWSDGSCVAELFLHESTSPE